MLKKILSRKLFTNSLLYLLSSVLNAMVPFLLIPLLSEKLSFHSYGILSLMTVTVSFLNPIIGLSIHGALSKRFFDLDEVKFKKYTFNIFLILIMFSGLLFSLNILFSPFLQKMLLLDFNQINYVIVICLTQYFSTLFLVLWQVSQKALKYAIYQFCFSLVNILFSFYFILFFDASWESRIVAWLITNCIFLCFIIFYFIRTKSLIFEFDKVYILDALKFSIPLIPHTVGAMLIGYTSRSLIVSNLGLQKLAIFNIAFQISSITVLVYSSINNAYLPWLFNVLKNDSEIEKRKSIKLNFYLIFSFVFLCLIFISLSDLLFLNLIDAKYSESIFLIKLLAIAFTFNGIYFVFSNYLFYLGKTKILGLSTGIVSVIHIFVSNYTIKYFDLEGVAYSVIFSYFLLLIFTISISSKFYPIPWKILFQKKKIQ